MSGLVGWVDFRRDLRGESDVVHAMTASLRRRGPDAGGVWLSRRAALGHRTLATTADGGGAQPAVAGTGDDVVALVYDGVILNLADLRTELAARGVRAPTGDDTDVLLQAYLAWGEDVAGRLDGMFALAVWDARTGRLLLARDRLGVKPLYYATHPDGLLLASEPKGILASGLFVPRLDPAALPILLQPRLTEPGETPLRGLREVPPAHVLTFDGNGPVCRRYWELTSAPHEETFADTAAHVRSLLAGSVARQVPASGRCAAMLSGGVDSTAVAALAARTVRGGLDTYCLEFDDADVVASELRPDQDGPYAADAAAFIGSSHHRVPATMRDLTEILPATRRARDLPGWGQFDASMYVLFERMRATGPVAFSGEAADEFFGGYPYLEKPELVRRRHFPWLGDGPKLSDYLSPDVRGVVDPVADERDRYRRLVAGVPRLDGEDPFDARMREVLYLGMAGPLQVILDRKERMSAAHGLEVRLPFCDHRLVQYAWNVPWRMKAGGGLKGLLKAAVADAVPAATASRRKSAYPHIHDERDERRILERTRSLVTDAASPLAWMFDGRRLVRLVERVRSGRLHSTMPGGASGAQLFVQLVELHEWMTDYRVVV